MPRHPSTEKRLSSTGIDIPNYTSELQSSLQKKILPAVLSYFGDCSTRRSLLSQDQLTKLKTAMGEQFSKYLSEQLDKWETMITEDLLSRKEVDEFNEERKKEARERGGIMEGVEQLTGEWIKRKQQYLFEKELKDMERQLKVKAVKPEQMRDFGEISGKFDKLNGYLDETERYLDRFEGMLDSKINAIKDR